MFAEVVSQPRPTGYPVCRSALPPGSLRAGRYRLRFARNVEDLHAVQRLRFEVFNLELDEGLDRSYLTGRDEDEVDAACHHLVVEHVATGKVIGTYRVMVEPMADARGGFYSEGEYDFSTLPAEVRARGVELGRACVHEDHRNGRVIHLLWKGLGRYMAYMRHPEVMAIFKEQSGLSLWPLYLRATLDIPRIWWRSRRMTRRWDFDAWRDWLDVPLGELREAHGIVVLGDDHWSAAHPAPAPASASDAA